MARGADTKEDIKLRASKMKNRLTEIRKDDLRERINAASLITQIFEIKDKVHESSNIETDVLQKHKFVVDTNLRLLAKCLPDLKAVEMSGPDGGELTIQIVRFGDKDK